MPNSPFIYAGNYAKSLKSSLNVNDTVYYLQGTADPTSVAQDAPQGSIYLRTGGSGGTAYLKQDSGSTTNWTVIPLTSGSSSIPAIIKDKKAYNVNGGSSSSGAWHPRDLTINETSSLQSFATLSSNQVTVSAGTYQISAKSVFYISGVARLRWWNTTDSTADVIGGCNSATPSPGGSQSDQVPAFLDGVFVIGSSKVYELQYYCSASTSTSGLGIFSNISGEDNYYSSIVINKLA